LGGEREIYPIEEVSEGLNVVIRKNQGKMEAVGRAVGGTVYKKPPKRGTLSRGNK